MSTVDHCELIERAAGVLKPYRVKDRLFGDVGAALLSEGGRIYTGVSVDTFGWGLCAERSAMAAMITAQEYIIKKVVAVWRDEQSGKLHVLPPCGICRDFMRHVDESNLEAEIILSRFETARLKQLIPLHEWPSPLEKEC